MQNLLNLITQYLVKGGLVSAFTTYILPTIRRYITNALSQLAIQMVILGALLFIIDWVLPRILPQLFQRRQVEEPQ